MSRSVIVQNLSVEDLNRLKAQIKAASTENAALLKVVRAGLDALDKPKKAKKKTKKVTMEASSTALDDVLDGEQLAFGD